MNGIVKVLTGILGILAVIACLATVGIVGYSLVGGGNDNRVETAQREEEQGPAEDLAVPTQVPEEAPDSDPEPDKTPAPLADLRSSLSHVHDYEESLEKKATCYSAGKIKYTCECGDTYYVDIMSIGHVAGDWETVRKPAAEQEGLRVRKCIYCDEILAQENIVFENKSGSGGDGSAEGEQTPHVHQYTASTEREPSCTLAGLRKYSCSCGNFYTEMIPAPGHVATDWTVAAEATTTKMGTEQRTCVVCGVLLDSRPINTVSPSPGASASPAPGASASAGQSASASPANAPTPSAAPSATPHAHDYQSYILKEANCTEKGIRSFTCSCGSNYAESIELNPDNHTFRSVVIRATTTSQGYTVYTCIRCNYAYFDNYTPAIGK